MVQNEQVVEQEDGAAVEAVEAVEAAGAVAVVVVAVAVVAVAADVVAAAAFAFADYAAAVAGARPDSNLEPGRDVDQSSAMVSEEVALIGSLYSDQTCFLVL
jgi:hypothetical protein